MPGSTTIVAIFGPTGIGKTAVAIALAERLRAGGEDPAAISADALQLYRGLEILTGAPSAAERERLEHRLVGTLPLTATSSAGEFARAAHAEIDALLARGRRPIVVGGTGLYLRAALAELDLRPPVDPAIRARRREQLEAVGAPALHAELAERAPATAAAIRPQDAQRVTRALELLDAGQAPPPGAEDSRLWTAELRRPTLLAGLTMDREALNARIEARVDAMVAAGAEREVRAADAAGASPGARQALGFEALLAGDVDAMKAADAPLRQAPADLDAQARGRADDRRDRARPRGGRRGAARRAGMMAAVRFEKWQALGNDYLIVEAGELPFELSEQRVRRLCDPHFGPGGDGILELSEPSQSGFVARLRIFNPDGSEAELSGNGAREAILYLRRRGWTEADTFSIETVAGEIRPTITGETTCRVDMGRARLQSKDFPAGRGRRLRRGRGRRAPLALPARLDRQPAVRDPRRERGGARRARPGGDRPRHPDATRSSPTAPTRRSGRSSRRA